MIQRILVLDDERSALTALTSELRAASGSALRMESTTEISRVRWGTDDEVLLPLPSLHQIASLNASTDGESGRN